MKRIGSIIHYTKKNDHESNDFLLQVLAHVLNHGQINIQKHLAVVNGKSLLQRNIEYLQQYGITDVVVNVHHFAEQIIETAIVKSKGWGSNIIISDERDEVLETGGGLLKAKNFFTPGETFITCNVDILTDLDLNKLSCISYRKNKPLITFRSYATEKHPVIFYLMKITDFVAGEIQQPVKKKIRYSEITILLKKHIAA